MLHLHKILNRTEIIPQMQITGAPDAADYCFHRQAKLQKLIYFCCG